VTTRARLRRHAPLLALAAVLLVGTPLLVHPWFEAANDASIYIATARSIARGEGVLYLGIPFRVRPPGFPFLIAPLVEGAGPTFRAVCLVGGFSGAAVALLAALRSRAWLGPWLAAACGLLLWTNPVFQGIANRTISDMPATALMLACLLLERRVRRSGALGGHVALGVAIGLAAHVRDVLAGVAGAVLLARLLEPRSEDRAPVGRRAALGGATLLATLLTLAPWTVYGHATPPPAPAEQTLIHTMGTAFLHTDPGDPDSPRLTRDELLERVPDRASRLVAIVGGLLQGGPVDARRSVIAAVLGLSVLVLLVRRRDPGELFALLSLPPLLVMPFGLLPRYGLPLLAIALPAAVEVTRDVLARAVGARWAGVGAGALVLGAVAGQFAPRAGWEELRAAHEGRVVRAAAVAALVPEGETLAAWEGFHHEVYLDRPVYSLRYVVQRTESAAAIERVIELRGIEHVLMDPTDSRLRLRKLRAYLSQHYTMELTAAGDELWRVRPRGR
jgi:4-amino-4-deoxy-L-arabinose transferase-like glycosyltransferase